MKKTLIALVALSLLLPQIAHADITSNLKLWWRFDEGSGTSAADSSASALTGALQNTPTWATGKIGPYSLSFDGVNKYVKTSSATTFITAIDQPHSYFAWVNPTVNNVFQSIINFGEFDDVSRGSALSITSGGKLSWTIAGAADTVDSTLTVSTGAWSFVGFSRTATDITFYVNGTSETVASVRTSGVDANDPFLAGASAANGAVQGYFTGGIDEPRVYTRALSASDVAELYLFTGVTTNNVPKMILNGLLIIIGALRI